MKQRTLLTLLALGAGALILKNSSPVAKPSKRVVAGATDRTAPAPEPRIARVS